MTDNEIIKALKRCGRKHNEKNDTHCKECHFKSYLPCVAFLCDRTIDLINRQKAEIEKYKNIKTTMDEFWDILLRCKVANRKEKPTLEELADSIHQIEVNAIKEFTSRIERVLSLHPAQAKYYYEIKKEYIKENESNEK